MRVAEFAQHIYVVQFFIILLCSWLPPTGPYPIHVRGNVGMDTSTTTVKEGSIFGHDIAVRVEEKYTYSACYYYYYTVVAVRTIIPSWTEDIFRLRHYLLIIAGCPMPSALIAARRNQLSQVTAMILLLIIYFFGVSSWI